MEKFGAIATAIAIVVSACSDRASDEGGTTTAGTTPTEEPRGHRVDVYPMTYSFLFVIDDGPGSAEIQRRLADAMDEFVDEIGMLPPATYVRIGFVTSDDGHFTCDDGLGSGGHLRLHSCHELDGSIAIANACASACPLDTLQTTPTHLYYAATDGEPATARKWLELSADGWNLDEGVDPAHALACAAIVGDGGCRLSSPLGAGAGAGYGNGFEGHAHAITFVSASLDCTPNDNAFAEHAFDPEGDRLLWPDPTARQPTEALCWAAGVKCSPEDGPPYESCAPQSYDEYGREVSPQNGILTDVGAIAMLLDDNGLLPVQAAMLVGVPVGWPDVAIPFAELTDPTRIGDLGVGSVCGDVIGVAPDVRTLALYDHFVDRGRTITVGSICADDYGPLLGQVARERLAELQAPGCTDLCILDADPDHAGLQPNCEVEIASTDHIVSILQCDGELSAPRVPDDAPACWFARAGADRHPSCGARVELGIVTSDRSPPPPARFFCDVENRYDPFACG